MFGYCLRLLILIFLIFNIQTLSVAANDVLTTQKLLTELGYNPGPIDGSYGGKTRLALEDYYTDQRRTFDGKLDLNEVIDLIASFETLMSSKSELKKPVHMQHARYSNYIATSFRDLKVNKNFTLIDNFASFIETQNKKTRGRLPNSLGPLHYLKNEASSLDACTNIFDKTSVQNAKQPSLTGTLKIHDLAINCATIISQVFLNDPKKGINIYRKILQNWLENGIIQNPNAFLGKISRKNTQNWAYAISSFVPNILAHYAIYHRLYDLDHFTHQNIILMGEAFFAQWDYYPFLTKQDQWRSKLCNLKSQTKVIKSTNDHCGSYTFRMATGGIYFGLEFNSQIAFDTGVRNLEVMLATFNKDAIYVSQAERGICALGYMGQFPPHFELIHYAFQKAYGIDFINIKNINGVTPAEAYLKLWKVAHDPLDTLVKYWNGHDQMSCSENGKNQLEMVEQLTKYPSSYREFWNGFNDKKFILLSPFLALQELPEEWKVTFQSDIDRSFPFESEIQDIDMVGINPFLMQFSLGSFNAEQKRLIEEKRTLEQAERLRLQNKLKQYDGTYKVHLELRRSVNDNQVYQPLGSIILRFNRGQAKLDQTSILYQAFGLNGINFSLDQNGYVVASGQILAERNYEKKCIHIAGNLNSNQKLIPILNNNCRINDQHLTMKFEKISHEPDFDVTNKGEIENLNGNYDVRWFIKGLNSVARTLHAKDTLALSNGIGVFLGNDTSKQPSSELRRKLLVQYNANSEIIILGFLDLMEKKDVKKWFAFGELSSLRKTTIKTIWGLGDEIELEIEKQKIKEIAKVEDIKIDLFNYNDDFIFDEKNKIYQFKRHSEITGINESDLSLSVITEDEKKFSGDVAYKTNRNIFGTTWIDLKIKDASDASQNIKIAFQIEKESFPNFSEAFSISKSECGIFEDMADDSFIIPLKTGNLSEIDLFNCHTDTLQKNLNQVDFAILKDRINTVISLLHSLDLTQNYFQSP